MLFMKLLGILILIFMIGFRSIGLVWFIVFWIVMELVILKVIFDEFILWKDLFIKVVLRLMIG